MAGTAAESMRVDKFLTDFAVSFKAALPEYVADVVAPRVTVKQRSGKYRVWQKSEDYRIDSDAAPRRPGTESSRIDVEMTEADYSTAFYARHVLVPKDDETELDGEVELELESTERLVDQMLALREKRVAGVLTDPAKITQNLDCSLNAGANQFSTAGSNPFTIIQAGIAAVYAASGVKPNQLVLPWDVAIALRNNAKYIERYQNFKDTVQDLELAPKIMGLTPVIAGSQFNSAKRDTAKTLTLQTIWGKNAIICYTPNPDVRRIGRGTLCTMKSFWLPDQSHVIKWFENKLNSTYVEQQECISEHLVAAQTAYLLRNVIA